MKKNSLMLASIALLGLTALTWMNATAQAQSKYLETTTPRVDERASLMTSGESLSTSDGGAIESAQPRGGFSFGQQHEAAPFVFAGNQQHSEPTQTINGSVVYMVANSHIDTQWNWTVQDTIRQWVPRTFYDNFKLFEKYPD